MLIYDANVFNAIDYDMLYNLVKENDNYVIDDVVLELIAAKNKYSSNEKFKKVLELVLNDRNGINESFTLILSKITIGDMKNVEKNTKSIISIKSTPLSCVIHHLWLTFTLSPSGITFLNRTTNSLLTDHLKQKIETKVDNHKIENVRNKLRMHEMAIASKHYNHDNANLKNVIRTWAKRNTDILNNKFKYTDAKLIVASLDLLLHSKNDIKIVTSDYDLIDLQANLFLSIYDQYTLKKVLERYCKSSNLTTDRSCRISVPIKEIMHEYDNTYNLVTHSSKKIQHTILFYNQQIKNYESFTYDIPDFIYSFLSEYIGNFFCFEIDSSEKVFKKNIVNYRWYMPNPYDKEIKYDVWLKNDNKSQKKFPACKTCCMYETKEYNAPQDLSSFIIPEKTNNINGVFL